ncbi:MAG: CBS domain-containing protein [Leptolyngbyaceae cyanobacterium bins.59]|nr:CBS domain-containing protein [Leptolyngbyaceae cyanobacterium bins.59]
MDLILCHTTADFDTLGAAVGLTLLHPGSRIVLTGGSHPTVQQFLALHRDEYALIERRSVNQEQIRSLTVVDTQRRYRLGVAAEWLDLPGIEVTVYDHHIEEARDIPTHQVVVEDIGATTTLIVEQLQAAQVAISAPEATVMALGIHVDTGSLTFEHATFRDALALAWLMGQGAIQEAIGEYVDPGLSPVLQEWMAIALNSLQTETVHHQMLSWVVLHLPSHIQGLSALASKLVDLTNSDALLLVAQHPGNDGESKLILIARSRIPDTNWGELLRPLGGGGHPRAAAATLRGMDPEAVVRRLLDQFKAQIPQPPTARELMSSPVRTIRPETPIDEAHRILLRYGHSGLSVVDAEGQLVGIISRRDLDIALRHRFGHAPVRGYMTTQLRTITPETPLPEIESLMVVYDIGRLPVLDQGQLVGIVTRTDVLRQLHRGRTVGPRPDRLPNAFCPLPLTSLQERLLPELWELLAGAAQRAEQEGWHLYLVGGAVRDLLLADADQPLLLSDIDLVVDGFYRALREGAGVDLARSLCETHSEARLQVYGQFQTAALLWHHHPILDSLWIDFATARTEFYPYPAANPEVEASSIQQDLYRRDFTINAMAIRLTNPRAGELLDFFGGTLDLQARQIRVLHANSFIEDPTRIFRAVRFAVRLGFRIEPQTEGYIRHAIESGIYERVQDENDRAPALQTRLKAELKYILQAPYWRSALTLLSDLGALQCIHKDLTLDRSLWHQLKLASRLLQHPVVEPSLPPWQTVLEIILASLPSPAPGRIARNLQLPIEDVEQLEQLEDHRRDIEQRLVEPANPSQIVEALKPYPLLTLVLVAVQTSGSTRKLLWRYLTVWSRMKAPIDGNDLKQLGYKPGRHFKQILDDLLQETLDGKIRDRAEAEAFLGQHYPLNLS